MKWKKILVIAILLVLLVSSFYAYKEYTRRIPSLSNIKPDFEITDTVLINEFINNEQLSGSKYQDKVVLVKGQIKSIDTIGNHVTISLGKPSDASSIKCSMDSTEQLSNLVNLGSASFKGIYIGFNRDDLIGSDVYLNRCVLVNK